MIFAIEVLGRLIYHERFKITSTGKQQKIIRKEKRNEPPTIRDFVVKALSDFKNVTNNRPRRKKLYILAEHDEDNCNSSLDLSLNHQQQSPNNVSLNTQDVNLLEIL